MTYATASDVQVRLARTLSDDEINACTALLEDAAAMIDSYGSMAGDDVKRIVSCRMVARAIGDGNPDIPVGATQGSMSGLGYSQSWTIGSGSAGEVWLSKVERQMLGVSNRIGSHSPLEDSVCEA